MDETTCDLLVVGGGLTGLIAGLRCADKHSVTVLEGRDRLGGRTETPNGDRRKRRQHGSISAPISSAKGTGRRKTSGNS